jgi:predicted Zn-dependent peptidase
MPNLSWDARSPARGRSASAVALSAFGLVALVASPVPAFGGAPPPPAQQASPEVKIPFTKSVLANGMTLILSEGHTVPQVVVNTSYQVGSRMERGGRTGFAHLFEHLMFMGTQRAPRGAFDAWMEGAGGRNNAWTAEDRTDYFDVAPPTALPLLLWLEADRMRDLGPLIDQEKLDLQRDVVLNERRQSIENRPYGTAELQLPELLWPEGHPYHHPVIGSPADLKAATVADVRQFFSTWYDPADASLVVAGDFDPQHARSLVEQYFGAMPTRGKPTDGNAAVSAGSATPEFKTTLTTIKRLTVPDNVELAKVIVAWQSPRHFGPGDAEMDLLASVLSSGKASRLYKALVYDEKIAQSVQASQESRVLASDFVVEALVRPNIDPARVEKAILDQIAKVTQTPVTAPELDRARNGYEMAFVDRLQSVGERASLLNMYQAETGDPGYVQQDLDRYRKATPADLLAYAKKVLLPDALVVLTIVPNKEARR